MALASVECGEVAYSLSYELVGELQSPAVLILHGWGASKELMKRAFGGELSGFCHIYLDLCGFGKSGISHPLTTAEYAKIVLAFLRQKEFVPKIIIAHSFGGKVATLLSEQIPLKVLVLLSSAGIVWQKSFKVRAKIAIFKCLKMLGISGFRSFFASKDVAGMSQTMYETFKNVVDEDFCEFFKAVKCRTLIFWGLDDTATPLKSGQKLHSLIANSEFYALKGGHFFFLKNAKTISQSVENAFKMA